jgi:hypothetical protein
MNMRETDHLPIYNDSFKEYVIFEDANKINKIKKKLQFS